MGLFGTQALSDLPPKFRVINCFVVTMEHLEPKEKRLKIDEISENADSNNNVLISKNGSHNCKENESIQQDESDQVEIDAGNGRPVCELGVDCHETDLIHFADFWHPTKTNGDEEDDQKESGSGEVDECEVEELPFYSVEATQEVYDDPSDSESDNGDVVDGNSNTIKHCQGKDYSVDSLNPQ